MDNKHPPGLILSWMPRARNSGSYCSGYRACCDVSRTPLPLSRAPEPQRGRSCETGAARNPQRAAVLAYRLPSIHSNYEVCEIDHQRFRYGIRTYYYCKIFLPAIYFTIISECRESRIHSVHHPAHCAIHTESINQSINPSITDSLTDCLGVT